MDPQLWLCLDDRNLCKTEKIRLCSELITMVRRIQMWWVRRRRLLNAFKIPVFQVREFWARHGRGRYEKRDYLALP